MWGRRAYSLGFFFKLGFFFELGVFFQQKSGAFFFQPSFSGKSSFFAATYLFRIIQLFKVTIDTFVYNSAI